jgi:hypothetical protein
MAVSVKLKDIVDEISFTLDEASSYLNTKTGDVVTVTEEELQAAENEEPLEDFPEWQHDAIRIATDILETDDYLPLPTKFDIHEYSIMERFCRSVEDDDIGDDLCNAIRGRGAFGRFKDRIHEYGIADDWYTYLDGALREIAIAWCEENGISYTE